MEDFENPHGEKNDIRFQLWRYLKWNKIIGNEFYLVLDNIYPSIVTSYFNFFGVNVYRNL